MDFLESFTCCGGRLILVSRMNREGVQVLFAKLPNDFDPKCR